MDASSEKPPVLPGPDRAVVSPEEKENEERGGDRGTTVVHNVDDVVANLSSLRRWTILLVVSWMCLPMTFLSTAIMTVTPEMAVTLGTTATDITTANAGVFVAMALSPLLWLPLATLLGRRATYLTAAAVMGLCSVGCALAPNLACLTTMWLVSGTTGPFFLTAGQTILSDIFEPAVRGTAVGFFLGTCVSTLSISPMIGGVIASYTSWRVIYGVQGGITFLGFVMSYIFLPRRSQLAPLPGQSQTATMANAPPPRPKLKEIDLATVARAFNPMPVIRQWRYPPILLANISCGLLAVNQYGLLSTVRHIINPRFDLTSPLYGGLFYLAPGVGFLSGSLVGGNISDRFVRRHIRERSGVRIPEDRLASNLIWSAGVLPLGTLVYGWSVDQAVGGLGVPIVFSFVQGFGMMAAFSVLNTYAAEAHPEFKMAVISGKYVIQYCFSAASVGGMIPIIDAIGTGWTFTICAAAAFMAAICVVVILVFFVRPAPGKPLLGPYSRLHISPSKVEDAETP